MLDYNTSFNDCTDITAEFYVSSCDDQLPFIINTDTSNSITPVDSGFIDGNMCCTELKLLK